MTLTDIIAGVEEKCDGRTLATASLVRWANLIRYDAARTVHSGGFHGLFFLYKEATVDDGSVANQSRYKLPDDFVDDLNLWYDGKLLVKADPGVLDITLGENNADLTEQGGTPTFFSFRGREIDIIPMPVEAGDEIKLFYNSLPETIQAGATAFTDYFLTQYPKLHIYGMVAEALDSLGADVQAERFRKRYENEVSKLALDNRRFWMKHTKMRLQNWDEFVTKQRHVFPQFGELQTLAGEIA